jgi:hypothetical protein
LTKNTPGIDEAAAVADFKVQVRAKGVTGIASRANHRASPNTLANSDIDLA